MSEGDTSISSLEDHAASTETNDNDITESAEPPERDFREQDELSDLTLIIEGQRLYVHKQYLAEWSPVWRRMFLGGFLEQNAKEIPLPGKDLEQFTELLHCIYASQKPISEENVKFLLELAEEYQMDRIKKRCEEFLINQERTLDTLLLARKYDLKNLYRRSIEFAKTKNVNELERNPDYRKLDDETKLTIYKAKIDMLKDYANDVTHKEAILSQENSKVKMERDNMKACLLAIEKLWNAPNKRCFRHTNSEEFDYKCADCNENMYREARILCGRGQYLRRYFPPTN